MWKVVWEDESPSPRPALNAGQRSVGTDRWTWDDDAARAAEPPSADAPARRWTWDADAAPPPPAPADGSAWVARPAVPDAASPGAPPAPSPLGVHAKALPLAAVPQILLAEPDHTTARVLQHRLSREGMAVTSVAEAAAAQEHLRLGGLDLLLLDADLPGGAFEVLRAVRSGPVPDLPVIVLGWPGNDLVAVRAFGLGTDDVITRPFSLPEAVARVQYQIARHAQGRAR